MFLFILIFAPYSLGEGFPPKGGRDEYPIYWYLHRHGERLMKELNMDKEDWDKKVQDFKNQGCNLF